RLASVAGRGTPRPAPGRGHRWTDDISPRSGPRSRRRPSAGGRLRTGAPPGPSRAEHGPAGSWGPAHARGWADTGGGETEREETGRGATEPEESGRRPAERGRGTASYGRSRA